MTAPVLCKQGPACDALRPHTNDLRPTRDAEHARRLVRSLCDQGVECVVVAGGDGLIHLVAQELAACGEAAPVLGIIPAGTGNDLARHLQLPLDDPESALQIATGERGRRVRVDLLEVHGETRTRICINQVTVGFGAQVTRETPAEVKQALGGAAYLTWGSAQLAAIQPTELRVEVGEWAWSGACLGVSVANGGFGGGGLAVHHEPSMCDGALDLAILPVPADPAGLLETVADLVVQDTRRIVRRQAREVRLVTEGGDPLSINLDGEGFDQRDVRIRVRPRALSVAVPANISI